MDAEIRRLTYVPRFAGSKAGTPPLGSFIGQLPSLLRKEELLKQSAKLTDVRAEARMIELERERMENDRHHREALAVVHQTAAEELATALQAQKEKLEQELEPTIGPADAAPAETPASEAPAASIQVAIRNEHRISATRLAVPS